MHGHLAYADGDTARPSWSGSVRPLAARERL